MTEEVQVSVVRRRALALAGPGSVDCVTLPAPYALNTAVQRYALDQRPKSEGSFAQWLKTG